MQRHQARRGGIGSVEHDRRRYALGDRNFFHIRHVRIDVRSRGDIRVPEPFLNLLEGKALLQQQGRDRVPLRYNYDKPEKPRRIKGFEVFSLVFSSFSKPKNHTEISRIVGGVSLTTNE